LAGQKVEQRPVQSIKVRFKDQVSIYFKRVFCCGCRAVHSKKERDLLDIMEESQRRLDKELSIDKIIKKLRKLDIII
jgi:hypothetical protein